MVVDTVTVFSGTQTWSADSGKSTTVKRYDGTKGGSAFGGALVNVTGGELILQNITIDGENKSAQNSLITVSSGATLTLNDGATLQNNKNEGSTSEGGGVLTPP